jgi:N-acetylglucosaminyl-diphospho-decaprenol L-rhamnosyltransferase
MPRLSGRRGSAVLTEPASPVADEATAADEPTIAFVVVTYNNAGHIAGCLRSIAAQRPNAGSRIIVLDNASTDGTADLVEQGWTDVRVIRSPANLGFARACNRATEGIATRFVLMVNPDAILQPGCIDALLDVAARHPRAGLYGGRSYTPEGEVDRYSCFGRPTLWGLCCFATGLSAIFARSRWLNPEGIGAWARDTERPVGVVSGCLLLVDRIAWERLGGFDGQFFMYGEDVDLSVRAAGLGYAPMITPAAGVVHIGGASSSPVNKHILLFRGKITLARKLWTGPRRRAAEGLLAGGVLLRAVLSRARGAPASPGLRTSPKVWVELWQRRGEWRDGWARTDAQRAGPP